jgi:hypothetical protein
MKSVLPKGMNSHQLGNLPAPVKGAAALLGGGSIMTVAWFATNGNTKAMMIVGCGMLVVCLLLALYRAILGWFQKRRANPLAQGIAGNAAAAPNGISEPARRARLDDLRRNFEQGVEKFRAAGKNMYSVPWYVVVGEPGSGKTEAIRHCNVGFPPGLQDQLQGAGGTLNMNWWFTNSAIILDTAGRLMFEEVVPGTTNEWNEFLNLLKKNRPNCPINGMLLVIPVDTLIKDTADNIEKKAGKIAQQFDQIQRTLGVRFPVFVIITKCDLLNGFREFFDDLNDPQLQHQMMGWSNPASLDDRFDPTAVTNHLETVKQRLIDRRRQLLLDPVNTEDPNGRRTDQVDALYALPDALMKIAPRLRRYLEMIFVAGEWSPKPLFLRGIYFTSSMTEGSALDAELAEVLGVAVDSLPEGRVWRRDRAYFLRDLFIEKVFRERGLVTRASNADKQQRTRRAIILTFGFLAVIALGVFTWLGSRQLENSIGKHRDFWIDASKQDLANIAVINTTNNAYRADPVNIGHTANPDTAQMFASNLALMQQPIRIPAIYAPVAKLVGDPNTDRQKAYRALYEATVLYPLFTAARNNLKSVPDTEWNHNAVLALAQILKVQATALKASMPAGDAHPTVDLDPLFKFVLSPKDQAKYQPDAEPLQKVLDYVYSPEAGNASWPPDAVAATSGPTREAVAAGVQKTLAYWENQSKGTSENIVAINKVKDALKTFRAADANLVALRQHPVTQRQTYFAFARDWQSSYADLQKARADALDAWKAVAAATKADPDKASLRSLYVAEIDRVATAAQKDYEILLRYTFDNKPADGSSATAQDLYKYHTDLVAARDKLADWQSKPENKTTLQEYDDLDKTLLAMIKGTDDTQHHRFEVVAQVYDLANKFVLPEDKSAPAPAPGLLSAALSKTDADLANANGIIDKVNIQSASPDNPLALSCGAAKFAVNAGTLNNRYIVAMGDLNALPNGNDPEAWPAHIQTLAKTFPEEHLLRPVLPLVHNESKTFNARFSPDAVGSVNEVFVSATKLVSDPAQVLNAPDIASSAAALKKTFDVYREKYRTYWTSDVFNDEMRVSAKDWPDFFTQMQDIREKALRSSLKDYGDRVATSLNSANFNTEAGEIQLALQKQEGSGFQSEAQSVLTNWRNLGDKSKEARQTLLSLEVPAFTDNYLLGTTKDLDNFVYRYWHSLAVEGLRVLANAGQADINAALQQLNGLRAFPLAPADAKAPDLTAAQVATARAALESIRGSVNAPAAAGGTNRTIAQGANTRDKDVDNELDRLRGTSLLADYLAYFDQLAKMLPALPSGAQTNPVTLTVAKDKMKGSSSIADKYTYMQIAQGNQNLKEAYLSGTGVVDQATVVYPSGDITFQFRDTPGGPIRQTETIAGPWATLRLLNSPNVKSVNRDGNKWTVEYTITDENKKTYPLWLTLDFGKIDLPDIKNWPVPPAGH